MSFSIFLKKLFAKKNDKSNEKDTQKLMLKQIQHKYLNKTPSQISAMSVRDITMALKQLNDYCNKKIEKTKNTQNTTKMYTNLIKQATVSDMVNKYICALIILWKTKGKKYEDLVTVKKTPIYESYMQNFDIAYTNAKQKFPQNIKFKKPTEMWEMLMDMVPDKQN